MNPVSWQSVHVAYHAEQCDDLIAGAVAPLFATTAACVQSQYFTRHWRRGPHLRLNFRATAAAYTAAVRPAVDEIVGGYLAAYPSAEQFNPAALAAVHARLAQFEQEPGPVLPWYPNNSVHDASYADRTAALGSPEAAALLADYYSRTTPLAFRMTDAIRAGGSRLGLALDILIATAHAFCKDGIIRGFVSFRSHAEAFLASTQDSQRLREKWDLAYAAHAAALGDRLRDIVADLDGGHRTIGFIADWINDLQPVRQSGQQLIRGGRISMDPAVTYPDNPAAVELAALSPFHRMLAASESWHNEIGPSEWFGSYRLILNYAYLHLTRLGVKPVERLLLCHFAANTVEDVYRVSAIARIAK